MARNQKDATYDHEHLLKDAGLVASSAAATVGGSAKVVDLGDSRVDARVIVDVTAIEVATGDEKYEIEVQVSNSPTFASGIFIAGMVKLGDSTQSNESADSTAGRREIGFSNEVNGTRYRYLRVFTRIGGSIATGINYSAYVVKSA
jgi:hypothetical protein